MDCVAAYEQKGLPGNVEGLYKGGCPAVLPDDDRMDPVAAQHCTCLLLSVGLAIVSTAILQLLRSHMQSCHACCCRPPPSNHV
jgi:hypothetical protein